MKYESVIGLEIHTELKTKTKMFCYSLNDPNEKHPNLNICPICMGHPGTLPVINREAVWKTILTGLALNGIIAEFSQFDRKNYFYPDLPKGYQISQYQHPLVWGGHLDLNGRKVRITRIHLEEDTGRLIHDPKTGATLVDFNRAGVPLMELVTEPDLRSGEEVREFGEELQKILRYLDVSDADMEKGQLRVEVNMSLRPKITSTKSQAPNQLGIKVEIKNINSFRFAADAADYEIKRQTELLKKGEKIIQETRGWDEKKGITLSQRSKEEAHDYRYFPEPDLPPLQFNKDQIEEIRAALPELPAAKQERFEKEYGLENNSAEILVRDKALAGYFEAVVSELGGNGKLAASFLTGDFLRFLRGASASVSEVRVTPENMAELLSYVSENRISNLAAKKVLEEMFRSGEDPSDIIERLGLWQISDAGDLEDIVRHIVKENSKAVEDYKKGKEESLQYLLGQVMRESRGKANPKIVREILVRLMKE